VREYIVDLVAKTRESSYLRMGVSPRASLALFRVAQAMAALQGRSFASPEDVQAMAVPVLVSRVIPRQSSMVKGMSAQGILTSLIESVPVPVVSGLV
jgi:MoxR-like ATPase